MQFEKGVSPPRQSEQDQNNRASEGSDPCQGHGRPVEVKKGLVHSVGDDLERKRGRLRYATRIIRRETNGLREESMSTPRALNRDLAKQNPEGTFDNPFEIVEEKLFTKGEKIATLNRWRQSLLEELSAAGEGMRTYGVTSDRARLLEQIEAAKSQLR